MTLLWKRASVQHNNSIGKVSGTRVIIHGGLRCKSIVGSTQHCRRLLLMGRLKNQDTLVGDGGMAPEFARVGIKPELTAEPDASAAELAVAPAR